MLTPMLLLVACSKSDDAQPVPEVQTGKMTKELIVNGTLSRIPPPLFAPQRENL